MIKTTPEHGGVHSFYIKEWLEGIEAEMLSTHNIIIARRDEILFENYRPPFHADSLHRMYSVSKSFVAIAVGFAMQDGLISLDDPIGKYFSSELEGNPDPNMGAQTIRQMLMMSTPKKARDWFSARCDDRVREYFQHTVTSAPCGSAFMYDSSGSFILGALVERLTKVKLIDYLREKLFDKIGISKETRFLYCPGGHSWGDSALLARPRDLLLAARFMLNGGRWNGQQLLNSEYVKAATSKLIDTKSSERTGFEGQGYGYQFWKCYDDSFLFNGMGCQFALCIPSTDIIMIYNGDNQGLNNAGELIISSFFEKVARKAKMPDSNGCYSLPENPDELTKLNNYADSLVLAFEDGEMHSSIEKDISDRWFTPCENPMGIKKFRLCFGDVSGRFEYTNAQGEKVLHFGLCRNEFGLFPEEGYSREVGSVYCPSNYYKCAASAAWKSENHLRLNVQVIDDYFGRLWIDLIFDDDSVSIKMQKAAEDFFTAYTGEAVAKIY
ncbi:MAG: serine hydrolase [Clostridiaceae bacterium]|nr:serine hydrolase [Clostridiaceae bacterium]